MPTLWAVLFWGGMVATGPMSRTPVAPRPIHPMFYQTDRVVDTFTSGIDTSVWTLVDENQDGYTWDTTTYTWKGIFPHPPGAWYSDNANYWAPPGAEAMIHIPLPFTSYLPGDRVFLRFYSVFASRVQGGEYATVAVRAYAGGQWGTWDTLWGRINQDDSGTVQISLQHLAGVADSLQLAFTYTDTAGIFGDGWNIDDIEIGHESPIPPALQEDFESACGTAAPPGWTVQDANGDGHSWWVGTLSEVSVPNAGACFAYYRDDYGTGTPAGEDRLISPSVPISGRATVSLSFDLGINFSSPTNESVFVELRTHDGTAWSVWDTIQRYGGTDVFTHVELDLSGILPAESVQVAFVYHDYDGGYHRAVGVDNVVFTTVDTFDVDVSTAGLLPAGPSAPRTHTPRVITVNRGRTQQSFGVHLLIQDTSGTVLYHDSTFLMFRDPGDTDTVAFQDLTLPVAQPVIRKAWTRLSTDLFAYNDTLVDTLIPSALVDVQLEALNMEPYGDPALPVRCTLQVHNLTDTLLSQIHIARQITDLTAGTTLVLQDTVVLDTLVPYAVRSVVFPAFQPAALDHDHQVLFFSLMSDDNPANDTFRGSFSTRLAPFGTILATYPAPFSPKTTGMVDLTYGGEDDQLYLLRGGNPGELWTLNPTTGQFAWMASLVPFQSGVQDQARALTWSAADSSFWIVQEGTDTTGGTRVYLAALRYTPTGSFTGDTLNLNRILHHPQSILAMDRFPLTDRSGILEGGTFWILGTDSLAQPTLWEVDPQQGSIVHSQSTPDSAASVAFLARGINWTLLGTAAKAARFLYLLDSTFLPLDSVAFLAPSLGVDFWERASEIGQPAAHIKAFATSSFDVYVLSLGKRWDAVGVQEPLPRPVSDTGMSCLHRGEVLSLTLQPGAHVQVDLYDPSGRKAFHVKGDAPTLRIPTRALRPGLYILRLTSRSATVHQQKLLILP